MNLQPYVTLLDSEVAALESVTIATPGITAINVDTAKLLMAELSGLVGGRTYPVTLDQSPTYPNIVYQLVSSQPESYDGYHVQTTDTYIIYVRAETYAELYTTTAAIESEIEGSTYSIEVTDKLQDYDPVQSVFRTNLEVSFTVAAIATASLPQSLPAALIYPVSTNADPSPFPNFVRQREHETFGIVIMTMDNNVTTLRRAIQGALLGYQVTAEYEEVEYLYGAALESGGGMQMWQDVYTDALYIEES